MFDPKIDNYYGQIGNQSIRDFNLNALLEQEKQARARTQGMLQGGESNGFNPSGGSSAGPYPYTSQPRPSYSYANRSSPSRMDRSKILEQSERELADSAKYIQSRRDLRARVNRESKHSKGQDAALSMLGAAVGGYFGGTEGAKMGAQFGKDISPMLDGMSAKQTEKDLKTGWEDLQKAFSF